MAFAPKNHPQQVAQRGAADEIDDRWTPLNLWIPWNERWSFTLDAAASAENHLCPRYFTRVEDGLLQSWAGERVWCNPPYSAMPAWVEKAAAETLDLCPLVVMLAPANRTEQRWWQEHVEPVRDRGLGLSVEFLPRRLNFASRSNLGAWYHGSAPFGCCLLIWRGADAPEETAPGATLYQPFAGVTAPASENPHGRRAGLHIARSKDRRQ